MLRALRITNVAIIDEIEVAFAPGMNVLTGETGAGKSIIMRALGLLCGDRGTTDVIRTDSDEAEIEAVFELADCEPGLLQDAGLAPADDLLVRRVINRSGKGRAYLNGSLATASLLSQLGSRLIHVYGQHEQALLLKPENHLELLDGFGKLTDLRAQMADAYTELRAAADRLDAWTTGSEAARQRLELLRFQVKELRDAKVTAGEEAQLQQEREIQRHAEKLGQICQHGEAALYSGDEAVSAAVARVATQLREAGRIEPGLGSCAEALQQCVAQLEDVAADLRRAAARIQHDPERLQEIEERLVLLGRLKRKYGCDADALPERLVDLEAELAALDGAGADGAGLREEVLARVTKAWAVARDLSRERQAAAAKLEKRMVEELRSLGMRGSVFRVVFTVSAADAPPEASRLNALGADVVQFYLSANPGEEPKPLARIASGGELSRIMLALKTLTAAAGEVPTLIFDEVDAGIGGAVAEAVGKRLRALGRSRQVVCITHLPQIAAQADHHFAVSKRVDKGRTTTVARAVRDDERVAELIRMLGGGASAESQRYARRLMDELGKAPAD
jgi:DNA repair protein RecN (Recombination protein N)